MGDTIVGGLLIAAALLVLPIRYGIERSKLLRYIEKTPTEKNLREIMAFAKKYPNSARVHYFSFKSTRDRQMCRLALQTLAAEYGVVIYVANEDVPTTIRPVLRLRLNRELPVAKAL